MPVGILVNSIAVLIGGMSGAFVSDKIPKKVTDKLPTVFGLCALAISVTLILKASSLTPVVLSVIIGYIIGSMMCIEYKVTQLVKRIVKRLGNTDHIEFDLLITVIVLFCFSGIGLFGALNEGFTGDSSILLSKSVLDFFTAIVFGASTGYLIGLISLPQCMISLSLYFSANIIVPLLSLDMLNDFRACGGILTLASALKIARIRNIDVINMLPAIVIVIPLSYLWHLIM